MFASRYMITAASLALLNLAPARISNSRTPEPVTSPATAERPLVVISDLHMGLGRSSDGMWDPTEDFRWTGALRGFLEHISRTGDGRVDLVIAGDFLEMWQPPADVKCVGDGADYGCTVAEMKEIVRRIIEAHKEEFDALATFSRRGANRLHIIAGNHDAALLVPAVWELVAEALESESGHTAFVPSGIWVSADGRVVIEHGHQIGSDVNRYKEWPKITARRSGREYLVRSWGELFLQQLFNAEEREYPIIDNLCPESLGARYRMEDRGLWRKTVDVARFVAFNLLQTSSAQKGSSLGRPGDPQAAAMPCPRSLGYRLFMEALPPDDPFRKQAEGDSLEARALRDALDVLARDLPEADFVQLCSRRAGLDALGAAAEATYAPRSEVMRQHILNRLATYPETAVFLYGHTHQLEESWPLGINLERTVNVGNSGAFQRLVDEQGFLLRSKPFAGPQEGLRKIKLEDLSPCYSFVYVDRQKGVPHPETLMWHMDENGTGQVLTPGSTACR